MFVVVDDSVDDDEKADDAEDVDDETSIVGSVVLLADVL